MWTRMWVPLTVVVCGLVVGSGGVAEASHDGNPGRIAHVGAVTVGDATFSEVFTMNPDGSDQRRITFDGGTFVKRATDYEGYIYNVYTSNTAPTWSPDGSTLAYVHYSVRDQKDIRAVDSDGRNMRTLFSDWRAGMFTWSPDGSQIAYADDRGVWIADADGSAAWLVVEVRRGLPPSGPDDLAHIVDLKWSPDGEKLALVESSGSGLVAGTYFLSVVDIAPPHHRVDITGTALGGEITFDWAPNGHALVLNLGDGLSSVAPDNSDHVQLTNDWGDSPVWSPDGMQILYLAGGESSEPLQLWSHNVASRSETQVSPVFTGFDLDWQPIQGSFWDDEGSVFISDIEWMAANGITKGCNPPLNDKYCPDGAVTRGQMAAFLVRALGLTDQVDDPFTDDDSSVFEADIEKLAAAGITKGCNPPANDRFCPDSKVTRAQMAAFLVRALGYTDNGGGNLFVDDDDSIFEADIDRLGTAGVTKGCNPPTNDRFCPNGNVTRGQMAAFLHRALG